MGLIVKLVGGGLGLASEAIHDYRARSRAQAARSPPAPPYHPPAGPSSSSSSSSSSSRPGPLAGSDAPPEYVEVADEATAERLVRDGAAERIVGPADDEKKKKKWPADEKRKKNPHGDSDSDYDSDSDSDSTTGDEGPGAGPLGDEAAWELDDTAARVAPPSYADAVASAAAGGGEGSGAGGEERMVRDLVLLAGPPPRPARRLPCPVVIPQRRPRNRDRGFVRAYAPALDGCGVSQDVFLKFQQDWLVASRSDPWIEVVYVAAGVVGFVPEAAAQVVGTVVQVVAGTARELQARHRRNTFLDRANQDLFMPRGLYAMVMAFKDEVPGQQPRGPLGRLAGAAGRSLFSAERTDINQAVARYSSAPDPDVSGLRKGMRDVRLASGQTYTEVELPEAAALVYPDLDRVVEHELQSEGKGKGAGDKGVKEKFRDAGAWVQDYMDRKAQAAYERDHQGSSLAVPSDARNGFSSRFSDPNHPVNSGSLVALVSGGAIHPAIGRRGRRAARQERRALRREYQDERRMANGMAPRGPVRPRGQRKGARGIRRILSQDVLYFLVVNLPTEEEVQQSVADLEEMVLKA